MTDAALTGQWKTYRRTGRREDREQLILRYLPLVKHVTSRLAACLPANVAMEDLHGWGIFGLLDAMDRYDADRGVKFETYAALRIRGAVLDGLRTLDWAPRSVRRRARELERAWNKVEARLGRPAEAAEVADELGIAVQELHSWMAEAHGAVVLSLQEALGKAVESGQEELGDMVPDTAAPGPESSAIATETMVELARAIDILPERERLLITLFYYEELRPKEIAQVMGISAARVSQLHTQALLRLRRSLETER